VSFFFEFVADDVGFFVFLQVEYKKDKNGKKLKKL